MMSREKIRDIADQQVMFNEALNKAMDEKNRQLKELQEKLIEVDSKASADSSYMKELKNMLMAKDLELQVDKKQRDCKENELDLRERELKAREQSFEAKNFNISEVKANLRSRR